MLCVSMLVPLMTPTFSGDNGGFATDPLMALDLEPVTLLSFSVSRPQMVTANDLQNLE